MQHDGESRARGPHPLPLFLEIASRRSAGDPARLARILAGLRRYQALPPAPENVQQPIVFEHGNVRLRDHGQGREGRPLLVVPSLINPARVLDLGPGRSLLAALAARGWRPLMVDWGEAPEPLGLTGLVEARLLPILRDLGAPVPVVGYCLGGTLAAALAAIAGPSHVSALALLATPWRFAGYGAAARARLADWWTVAAPMAAPMGAVPMELLQPAFWGLDEEALLAKYERLAEADAADVAAFATLEDWANSGPPLALAAASEMAAFFAEDAPGRGAWTVAGQQVRADTLEMPLLDVVAMRDRIVPPDAALSSAGVGERLEVAAGHVGMIVGGRADALLRQPLAEWLASR
ncbi:MAG: alpha/beta fold hydrolase [Polymorphobacter sp.]|uniref:alpha/beta fold hydrolase n=1 Tax=Polymorphobacter sp. TaxID=1909290 RepID=UPI003A87D958